MSDFWRHSELPWLESRYSRASSACYGQHSHPTVSIGLVEAGSAVVNVDDRNIAIGSGDLVMFNAEQVHACNPRTECEWSYHMLYFSLDWWQAIVNELSNGECSAIFTSPVLRSPELCSSLADINRALWTTTGIDTASQELELLSWINRLLSALDDIEEAPISMSTGPEWVEKIEFYIKEHADETIRLDKLCELAGVRSGALIRQFKQRKGLTPYAYLQNFRINRAKEMLKAGAIISNVAQDLGFADQSHLNRLFRRLVASTPGQYRNAMQV